MSDAKTRKIIKSQTKKDSKTFQKNPEGKFVSFVSIKLNI